MSDLMKVLDFDMKDLAANRRGQMSDRQKERAKKWGRIIMIAMPVVTVILVGIVLLIAPPPFNPSYLLWGGFAVVFFTLLGIYINYNARKGAEAGKVERITAVPQFKFRKNSVYLVADKKTFQVNHGVRKAMTPNELYHFYYIPATNSLVAAEPVQEKAPAQQRVAR